MEILEAYDLTGSYRAAAELVGCSHHTVAAHVAARDAGRPIGVGAPRVRVIDGFLPKVEELVDRSQGKVRADKVHEVLAAMGFDGSERTVRRAVADAKAVWRAGNRRVHRPWVTEPGLWLQYDLVYHYSAKRDRRDNHTLDKQVERAQKIADGRKPLKKDRFVKLTGARPAVDQGLVDRARQLAGLKGYVTNIPAIRLTGNDVVTAYHDLFQVERSFRMAKTDLRARPMFHHEADSIHAHLTVVFTALAISRHLQDATGLSIRKIVRTLRPLRDVTISINGNEIVATTPPGPDAHAILTTTAGH